MVSNSVVIVVCVSAGGGGGVSVGVRGDGPPFNKDNKLSAFPFSSPFPFPGTLVGEILPPPPASPTLLGVRLLKGNSIPNGLCNEIPSPPLIPSFVSVSFTPGVDDWTTPWLTAVTVSGGASSCFCGTGADRSAVFTGRLSSVTFPRSIVLAGLASLSDMPEGVMVCLKVCRFPTCGFGEKLYRCCCCRGGFEESATAEEGLSVGVWQGVSDGVGLVGLSRERRDF
jgi:hypothetical protein